MKRAAAAVVATLSLFVLVQLGSLALVQPFMDAGYQTVEDPSDPTNSLLYLGAILVATIVMLAAMRFGVDRLLQGLILFAAVFLSFYVFTVVLPPVVTVAGFNLAAVVAAFALGGGLLAHPEWYVIDTAGIVMGAGAAGLFGISFGLLPAILLLSILAVYDAISVYGTEHMLTLASGMMDLKVPIVFVIPLTLSYSYLDAEMPDPTGEVEDEAADAAANGGQAAVAADGSDDTATAEGESDEEGMDLERDALFIGLGDAVIPTVLVASAAFFAPQGIPTVAVPGIALPLPALTAMIGTIAGLLILLRMVLKGRAHAGLPLLNGGTIAGYLVGALVAGIPILQALGIAQYL